MAGLKTDCQIKSADRILFVDDDAAFLQIGKSILLARGYNVDIAHSAGEALEACRSNSYSIIIQDLLLPDMSGIDLLTEINRIQPDVLSVIITGYSSVEYSIQSLNLGAFAFLEKPVDPDRLLEVIHRGLEKQHLLQENRRLLKELEQRNRDLNILLSVSQAVTCSLDPEKIINSALENMARSLDLESSYIVILHNDSEILRVFRGFDEKLVNQLKKIDLNDSILQGVSTHSDPIILHTLKEAGCQLLSILVQGGYRSLMAVPLAAAARANGAMIIVTSSEHIFSPLEVNLFKAIGREIAIAIANSQLLEEASSAKALRDLDAMRTALLANVSHELRTPLAAIKGFASSLLQPDISFDEETRQSFIQTIDSEANRLSHLIDDLLLMSKIEAGVYKAKKEWYEIDEIINSIKDRLYSIAIKHNLRIDIPRGLPPVMVDGPRIGEVLSNLVENAVKYSPEASEIIIEVEMQGQEIVTRVKDSGIGIPKEYLPRVFDRFNQLPGKNGNLKGSGLGLSICRGIVESHGGRIWVESEPGKGTTFSYTLPVSEEK